VAGRRQGFEAREHEPANYRLRSDVTISSATNPQTGTKQYYVKSGETGEVFELGEEEYFFCVRLDGRVSFAEFRHAFEAHFGARLTFEKFVGFADDLVRMRVLEPSAGDAFAKAASALIEDILDPEDTDPRATPFRRTLFDPSRLFDALAALAPLGRALEFSVLPLLVAAIAIFAHNTGAAIGDFREIARDLTIFVIIPVAAIAINLIVRLIQGATAHRAGAEVRGLGVIFVFGVLPRFYLDENAIRALDDRTQRRIYSASLKTRLFIGSVTMILWAALRPTGGWPAEFMSLLSHLAFVSFAWAAIPLLKNDGYTWMTLVLGQPQLRERSLAFLSMRLRGKKPPSEMAALDQTLALLYGLATLLFLAGVVVALFIFISVKLEGALGGPGVVIAFGFLALSLAWYLTSLRAAERVRRAVRENMRESVQKGAAAGGAAVIQLAQPAKAPPRAQPTTPLKPTKKKLWLRFVWSGLALAFLIVLLLPYRYKPGGEFEVLPNWRHQVNARIEGEIAEIFVKEGQWVEKGQPLVRLNNWLLERQLAESKAELDRSRAVLAGLLDGATREEIAFAESQVASAASRLGFKKTELDRSELLLKEGITTLRAVEAKRSEYGAALADLQVAKANLAVVKAKATEADLDAARAQVRKFENEVAFRQEDIERLNIVAPSSGAVVTANVDLRAGAFLKTGDLVAEIEDTRTARIVINLAEADLQYVKVGDRVQAKPWGYSGQLLYGKVADIAPSADESKAGRHVRVVTELPNDDNKLRPQMSGYAKVEGEMMQVWRAYLLFFIRFVQVEVWSWFP
jgi:multidrug resistance efflux pump